MLKMYLRFKLLILSPPRILHNCHNLIHTKITTKKHENHHESCFLNKKNQLYPSYTSWWKTSIKKSMQQNHKTPYQTKKNTFMLFLVGLAKPPPQNTKTNKNKYLHAFLGRSSSFWSLVVKLDDPVLFWFVGGLVAEKYLVETTLVLLGIISICIMNVHVHDHVDLYL